MEQLAIKVGGVLSILLGIGHCFFYRAFRWEKALQNIGSINGKILYTIHIFLIPLFFLFGYLSWMHPAELAGGSSIGITLTWFYAIFWLLRAAWQIAYFKPSISGGINRILFLHYFLFFYFFLLCFAYSIPIYKYLLF
jgi:uncharacterized membrane protein